MKLPIDFFLKGINEKKVYYFSSSKLNTDVPHYFICILKGEKDALVLVCCTSDKEDKRKTRIEKLGLHSTLVWLKPDNENGLAKDTFVDCNSVFEYSIDDFKTMYERDLLEYKGEISLAHYEQIINGLLDSPNITNEIKELLRGKNEL
jgi:hypothetical protein